MANLSVRNLDDAVIVRLQSRARTAGFKTLEPYIRQLLTEDAKAVMLESHDMIVAAREEAWAKHPRLPAGSGATLIREDRDA